MPDFFIEKKVYYHDTDSGGVVYYANYLKFLEEARTEFCLSRGMDLRKLFEEGMAFAVVHVEVDYKSPAKYGDTLKIGARVDKIGNSSVHFYQEIICGQKLLIKARTVWACVTRDFKARSLPQEIKNSLA